MLVLDDFNKYFFLFADGKKGEKEELMPEALNCKSSRNCKQNLPFHPHIIHLKILLFSISDSILRYSEIGNVRARAPTFFRCANNLRKDSIRVDWRKYFIEMVRRVGSGALPFSNVVEERVARKVKYLDSAQNVAVRNSQTGGVKRIGVKKVVNCDEFILTKKLEEFDPFSEGYDENTKNLFEDANEKAVREGSSVVIQLVMFIFEWNNPDKRVEMIEDGDFDDFGPRLTIEKAFAKITGKKLASILPKDFGKAKLANLLCVAKEAVECLKTRSWLFNDRKSVTAKLSEDASRKLKETEERLMEECKDDLARTNELENEIDKISNAIITKARGSIGKADKTIQGIIGSKATGVNKDILKSVLPEEIKMSCYKEYMRWLYGLLFKLRMKLFENKYVPDDENEDEMTTLKKGSMYSELVDNTRIEVPIRQISPDDDSEGDEDVVMDDDKEKDKDGDKDDDMDIDNDDDDVFDVSKAFSVTGTSNAPSSMWAPPSQSYMPPPQFYLTPPKPDHQMAQSHTPPQQQQQQIGPEQPLQQLPSIPPQFAFGPPSYPYMPPPQQQQTNAEQPLQQQINAEQPLQQLPSIPMQFTPKPPQFAPKPPSQPYMPPQKQQQINAEQPLQQLPSIPMQFTPKPPQFAPKPPSQPYMPPYQQQQHQQINAEQPLQQFQSIPPQFGSNISSQPYMPQIFNQQPYSFMAPPQAQAKQQQQQPIFASQHQAYVPIIVKKKSTFVPPKHVFKN